MTPSGLTGAAIAWSTTKRRLSPMPDEDQERVDEEEADAAGHRADARDHRHATDGTARSCDGSGDLGSLCEGGAERGVLTPWRDLPNVR